ncbi:MAG: hypothetical protein Q4C33_01815 [bacterium]|nr:hypothetical protein [bacterium]
MSLDDLKKEYDKMQVLYGDKALDSIYFGGCENNPDICFVFYESNWKKYCKF